ncbi:aminodeoxychorismate/anthranilate synthase component II [Methanohalobium sp.]|uniref:aminodeoxychorismate/anthranilate synthase component II n=1 Tax=Methanohalobium sp. TaxID=2837493 RepID=UPI002600902E|nr:aminodeoxychorismate/anthranilate synthase component II [Methanohalobium sp.]
MKILFINNKDSFVWNLVDYFSIYEPDIVVMSNKITLEEVKSINPDVIVISPGPGNPEYENDIGSCTDIIREFCAEIPVLGICLGNQAINTAFGGTVSHSTGGPVHGKGHQVLHDNSPIFEGISNPMTAGRYHSLGIEKLSSELEAIATTKDGIIMAVRHKKYPVYGLQFHPESVLTPDGLKLIGNFLNIVRNFRKN